MKSFGRLAVVAAFLLAASAAHAGDTIRLANAPSLSPDGALLAFEWSGDIWTVPTMGGAARQLTRHPARDRQPKFSPDGKEIAFVSERTGSPQVFVMPARGGSPKQLTHHTSGYTLQDWWPDGTRLLLSGQRDHAWRHAERFFSVSTKQRAAEEPLFDDYGANGSLSPDGRQLLFTREGEPWWRKGYHGSQASQIWLYDLEKKTFQRLLKEETGCLWPLWKPDGKGFYYVSGRSGSFNLWERDLASGKDRQLTKFTDDSVVYPCLSKDGSTIVFRHLFDFYRLKTANGEAPKKIEITHEEDLPAERVERRVQSQAAEAAFTSDGLEIAFIAGGDLWVMDTELREPRQVTATAELESHPIFSPDGQTLLFIADRETKSDVYRAVRTDVKKAWWQNEKFKIERLTDDGESKSALRFSPDGKKLSYLRARGDLWVADLDGKNAKKVIPSWSDLEYDWSPDGKWLVYAQYDNDFNRDIWLFPLDGSRKPFNLSRHPYNDGDPVWSPDGRIIAFTGKRDLTEVDIHYVWLRAEDEEKSGRERTLEKALEKMKGAKTEPKKPGPVEVVIDFDKIHERVHRISIPDSTESGLFWSPDSKKLAFTASVEGKRGTYTVEFPDDLKPKLLTEQTGSGARWLTKGNQIVWLSGGLPASVSASATLLPTTPTVRAPGPRTGVTPSTGGYRFTALQKVDRLQKQRAAFDLCWRTMRDNWYDERLGNRDWAVIRKKYLDMAGEAVDLETFTTVVQLMLGELNGSHLGFFAGSLPLFGRRGAPADPTSAEGRWAETTAHLGVRFETGGKGRGLKVHDVLAGGPADQKKGRLAPGDIVLTIDGTEVGPETDLTTVLNGPPARDVLLHVLGADGKERDVTLRPISYLVARTLLYRAWLESNRKAVETASKGKLGYLHISAMNDVSFHKFVEELYAVGAGRDGLVIDVRENGGGSTTDHLLTTLTQPVHAVTVPRGGEQGYPQDRKIYATWNKPIIVLCNQNSFSNAEIFSHAIKTLKRGKLVGVPTAGGVISTGAAPIMDIGIIRVPFRGWYLRDTGEDMELNGAVPDHIVWPEPGDMPRGKDAQLTKAVEVLLEDVKEWKARPRPTLRKATERPENVK